MTKSEIKRRENTKAVLQIRLAELQKNHEKLRSRCAIAMALLEIKMTGAKADDYRTVYNPEKSVSLFRFGYFVEEQTRWFKNDSRKHEVNVYCLADQIEWLRSSGYGKYEDHGGVNIGPKLRKAYFELAGAYEDLEREGLIKSST